MSLKTVKLLALLLLVQVTCAQTARAQSFWTPAPEAGRYQLQYLRLEAKLAQAPHESARLQADQLPRVELPTPDQGVQTFTFWQTPVMAEGLARQFPQLRTFAGKSLDGRSILRCDLSPRGFRAMILSPEGSWFIEPQADQSYAVFWKHSRQPMLDFHCEVEDANFMPGGTPRAPYPIGDVLRTYRLAVSATGEYTQHHGGTVEGAMAAIVTTMNRVNGIYERDIAVRMILVDSNHRVVYTNAATDPFSGSDGQIMNQNQGAADQEIGNENYDIGHVFHVGGGGVANLGAVCSTTRKARGFTSGSPPEGDFFDVDYVAHEMGHQFGANHTMGNCQNMNTNTAFEPGSGTSIMGYAGLCGSNNVALNSDDLFHVVSLAEMTNFAYFGNGNNCAETDSTFNTPPTIAEMPPAGLFIPISTPFELGVVAIDAENDSLTYSWDQYNLGPVTPLGNPQGTAPSFRIFRPSNNPVRVFPRLQDLVNNISSPNEVLPAYTRNLTFRAVVRDNNPGGGGVSWEEVQLQATEQAGPFVVQTANAPEIWLAGSFQTIRWDVANTDQAPVGADSVVISLSADGGFTYPYVLGQAPNSGSAIVQIPDTLAGNQFRVKVKGVGHVFFDINNTNIAIDTAAGPTLAITPLSALAYVCAPNDAPYTLYLANLGGYPDSAALSAISLPEGLEANLPAQAVQLPGAVELLFSGTGSLASGAYELVLLAQSDTLADTIRLLLQVQTGLPEPPALIEPISEAQEVPIRTTLVWESAPLSPGYEVEIATDPDFAELFAAVSNLTDTTFTPAFDFNDSTTYFWRVRSISPVCGPGPYSEVRSFSTERILCRTYNPTVLPVVFTSLTFIISRVEVPDNFVVRDVNLRNVQGTYDGPLGELGFRLNGPNVPYYTLLPDGSCQSQGAFNFSLDDEATQANIPCPYNNGATFRPALPLSLYDGINAQGTWRLFLYDGGEDGQLSNWQLELCGPAPLVNARPEPRETVELFLYPQPATQWVVVETPNDQAGELQLFSIDGRLVMTALLGGSSPLDVSPLPAGFYAYRWQSADGRQLATGKLVVAR